MSWDLWRYELRRLGRSAFWGPLIALAALVLFSVLAGWTGMGRQVNAILSAGLDVLPMIGGIGAASIVAGDPAVELHLTLPAEFRATMSRRLLLALGWISLLGLGFTDALAASNRLVWPVSPLGNELIWMAPMLRLAGAGATLSLVNGTAAAGSSLVGMIWVLQLAFDRSLAQVPALRPVLLFIRFDAATPADWTENRLTLLGLSVVLLGFTVWLLGRSETLLRGEA